MSNNTNVALFADDVKIYREINSLHDCLLLQHDLTALDNWSRKWKLNFNYDKCKVLKVARVIKNDHNYVMNNILLENMSNFNDLGINISSDLDWQLHIHLKVNKANSMLAFIKRTYGYSPMPDAKRMLYLTLIRSGLLYGSTVWYPNKACKKLLEGVQRRATKYILNDFESSYKQRLHEAKLVPLLYYKEYKDLCFLYKCFHGYYNIDTRAYVTMSSNTQRSTRSTMDDLKIRINNARTEKAMEYFFNRVVKPWNKLPHNIRSMHCTNKEILPFKNWLMNHYKHLTVTYFDVDNICTWVSFCRCPRCRPIWSVKLEIYIRFVSPTPIVYY